MIILAFLFIDKNIIYIKIHQKLEIKLITIKVFLFTAIINFNDVIKMIRIDKLGR